MFAFGGRKGKIKKALKMSAAEFKGCTPPIYQQFFYGAVDVDPRNLVVWFLFETDEALAQAKQTRLCEQLMEATKRNLISCGYPKDAFIETVVPLPDKVKIQGGTDEQRAAIVHQMTHRKAKIAFTTKEDIDKKANGDYCLYFH